MRPLQQLSTVCGFLFIVLVLLNLGQNISNAKSGGRGENIEDLGDSGDANKDNSSINNNNQDDNENNAPSLDKESLPEKMFEFGQFLKMLPDKISNAKNLPPKLSVKRSEQLLEEINQKRAELKNVESQIERMFVETYEEDEQVDLNVFLYNCRTFYLLTEDFIEQLL